MTGTTLPRALHTAIVTLAWATLPMLALTIAAAFVFPVRGVVVCAAVMLLCAGCALTRVTECHQDARVKALIKADDEQKRALIMALDARTGPSTGPMRILRDAS
jgi:hypothetical protein